MTAPQLAEALEVSVRTVLRDVETLLGVGMSIRVVRGAQGGFELADADRPVRPMRRAAGATRPRERPRVVRARFSPEGSRIALLTGRPSGLRFRKPSGPVSGERSSWVVATFTTWSLQSAVLELLALGPNVEVLEPADVRGAVGEAARQTAALHR